MINEQVPAAVITLAEQQMSKFLGKDIFCQRGYLCLLFSVCSVALVTGGKSLRRKSWKISCLRNLRSEMFSTVLC